MSGLELNKIAAAVLVAGLTAMFVGKVTNALYKPEINPSKRGYQIAVEESSANASSQNNEAQEQMKISQLMANANADKGKELFTKCVLCHSFEKGGANKIGPALWNVIDSPKAHHEGYSYSSALTAKGGNWTYEDMFQFLHSPKTFVPGTKMTFAGFKKPEDIANMVAYLRTLSDSPAKLPPIEK